MDELLELLKNSIQSQINTLFEWCGRASYSVLNASLLVYNRLVTSATEILSWQEVDGVLEPIREKVFVISRITGAVATVCIILFFLMSFASDTWSERKNLDLWDVIKDLIKLVVCIAIVNCADIIVYSIFSIGGLLASAVTLSSDGFSGVYINPDIRDSIIYGTPGLRGMVMFILFLFVALVVIACAVIVSVEIYQRLFKIYILIPFSTVSFSTFVMNDNKGNEIFHGYLKNLITLSIEAVVIMLCISFSIIFINSDIVDNAFKNFVTEKEAVEIDCNSTLDILAIDYALQGDYASYEAIALYAKASSSPLSDATKNFVTNEIIHADDDGYAYITVNGEHFDSSAAKLSISGGITSKIIKIIKDLIEKKEKPTNVVVHPALGWMQMFVLVIKVIFPTIPSTSVVKSS